MRAYRPGHTLDYRVLTGAAGSLFGREITDMLSGYRAFSRRYVKSFPALSREFETGTELTIHSLHLPVPVAETPVGYKERPIGGESKLRTYRDCIRILRWILSLTRHERPALFHGALAGLFGLLALILGVPVVLEYLATGLVPTTPTAILASTVRPAIARTLRTRYKLDREPTVINSPQLAAADRDVADIRTSIGLAEEVPLMVYGGGITRARAVETAIADGGSAVVAPQLAIGPQDVGGAASAWARRVEGLMSLAAV